MSSERSESLPLQALLVPSLITLAVTLLRLVGELQGWSPRFFSREAGGAGSVIGIVWLVPIFGIYFATKLARRGSAPAAAGVIGHAIAGVAIVVATGFAVNGLKLSQNAQFFALIVALLVAAVVAYRGWPGLGRTLFKYGLAARIPVILVMLVAIYANWGTHYDVLPPNPTPELIAMGPLARWLMIGLVPQLLLWIPFTMIVGALCGGLALLAVGRSRQPVTA
jgi:hypothetical protein